ncbi:MAG TPA: hypothetical protein VH912_09400, partial [Streptosporangiaceae bacterium]
MKRLKVVSVGVALSAVPRPRVAYATASSKDSDVPCDQASSKATSPRASRRADMMASWSGWL